MKKNPLGKTFTPLSIFLFTIPNIIMMVFMSLYTIVDGMFISRFAGEVALSATNMFYPVTSIQFAVAIMLNTGGSAIIAAKLGMGEHRPAKEDFTCLTIVSLLIGCCFMVICIPFLIPILEMLGTSSLQMQDALLYGRTLLWFSPMMFLQVIFQMFFVTAGKPNLGLGVTIIGGLANMILDYIFMGPGQMGVAGAAIATGIGYSIPAIVGLFYFLLERNGSLYFVKPKFRIKMLLKTCSNGSSEMISNAAIAITTFLFNIIFMKFWAEEGVATITILLYYQFVFSAVFIGFGLGISPIVSYKYGAKDYEQLKRILKFSIKFVGICSLGVYIIANTSIRYSLAVFTDVGSPVFNLAMEGFSIFAIQFLFLGISIFASNLFTALNNGVVSATISLSRTFLFLVSSLIILPILWGEKGVWFAVPVAEFAGLVVSIAFLIWGRKKYHY